MGADVVSVGPPQRRPTGVQGLVLDRLNNMLYAYGGTALLALMRTAVAVFGIQTAKTAITTAQTILSYAFGAGVLSYAGRTFVVKGTAIYSTTVTNVATIALALKLGSTTLATITTAATNTAASTNLPIQFEFTVQVAATGAAGTLFTTGGVKANIGTAAAAAIAEYLGTNTAVSSAVDLTAAQTLTVTVAGSAAIPSLQVLGATVEMVA